MCPQKMTAMDYVYKLDVELTTAVITHWLFTLRGCDKVNCIEDGRIKAVVPLKNAVEVMNGEQPV